MTEARIIPHPKYTFASNICINSIHSQAESAGLQAVTAEWLWEHPDANGYLYEEEGFSGGPWIIIAGIDKLRADGKIVLEIGRTGEKIVDPDFEVYVSVKDIEKAAA